ncbi:hypothetical protein HELRODRAFT_172735 [Helobdella robusta]|uniref:Uncharacterized protein n=1 Tax=Helobdella robusta TaxID=6412 RepID=T1F5V9_HELRO|nr:hypothetical protein HELRODRAFT_172735 [Helobdella robusta]ESO04369.1 hypothetical protein HELRODRAFT_172735 [Helobdella robusta]
MASKTSKLYFHIIKRNNDDFKLAGISENKETWYVLPEEKNDLSLHEALSTKRAIINIINSIKPINDYRTICIKLNEELRKEYYDEDENLCFLDNMLEEKIIDKHESDDNFLNERIKELEAKLSLNDNFKLQDVEKKFILEKFNKKQNPSEWIEKFENECRRHKILNPTNVIEALRFFLSWSPKDWYESNLKKIGLTNWLGWRKSFLTIFADRGWKKIRTAYNYKYLGGSLIDYALAKENLCLEIEIEMSRINMIVMGLPVEIQNQLDREEITTIEKLFKGLTKIDECVSNIKPKYDNKFLSNEIPYNTDVKKKQLYQHKQKYENVDKEILVPKYKVKAKTNDTLNKQNQRYENNTLNKENFVRPNFIRSEKNINTTANKPCFMCEELGWKNRYHPTNECRNKTLYSSKSEINIHDTNYQTDDEAHMMKIEIDKKSLN